MSSPAHQTSPNDLLVGTIVIQRFLTDLDDVVRVVECVTASGMPIPLLEAVGMLEAAKDELMHGPT